LQASIHHKPIIQAKTGKDKRMQRVENGTIEIEW
jgi:hypothetical protein